MDRTIYVSVLAFLSALGVPAPLAAQVAQDDKPKHHHYQIVEIGTFGGRESFFFTGEYDLNNTELLNQRGSMSGDADTSALDPFAPDFSWADGFVAHTFLSQN